MANLKMAKIPVVLSESVRLFLYLAIGILLIACINFMNLSTARSERRAKEVGGRGGIGSSRIALDHAIYRRIGFDGFPFVRRYPSQWCGRFRVAFSTLININLHVPYDNASIG